MGVASYIARRYVRPRLSLVTIIAGISVAGIAIGVAALIAVLSVFNGFSSLVTSLLVGFDPHVRVTPAAGSGTIDPAPVLEKLKRLPEVKAAAPFIAGRSAVVYREGLQVVQIRGMSAADIGTAVGLRDAMVSGRFEESSEDRHPIVLGQSLAWTLRVSIGDTISLLSQSGLEASLTQMAQPTLLRCVVTGIFESRNKEYDSYLAYTDLATARFLFALDSGVMGVEVRLGDFRTADQIAPSVRSALGSSYRVETWSDLHSDLFGVMELERWIAFIILSLIVIVAAFNVLGSLTMTVIEKRRDIGILKAMGARNNTILRTYLIEGSMVGFIGTVIGTILGVVLCILQQKFSLFKLDNAKYIISAMPVDLRWLDVLIVVLVALGLALVAALPPARRAARLLPADAVRWE